MLTKRKLSVIALCCIFGATVPAMAQQGPGPKVAAKANQIGASFDVKELKDGTYIRISGSLVPTFSVFKMADPARLFVDISNSDLGGQNSVKTIDNGVVSHVAMLRVKSSAQAVTRVIIGFDKAAHYDVRTEGKDVVIFIDGKMRRKTAPSTNSKIGANTETQRKYNDAMSALGHTRNKLQKTQTQLAQLRAKLKGASGKNRAKLKSDIRALESQATKAQAQSQIYKKEALKAQAQVSQIKREKQHLSGRLEAAQTKADRASVALSTQTKQLQKTRRQVQALEEQLIQARSKAAKGDNSAKQRLVKLERERITMGKTLNKERQQRNHVKIESSKARAKLASLQQTLTQRDAELATLKSRLAKNKAIKEALPLAKAVPVNANTPNLVRDIRLETHNGRSRIVVELDRPGKFETVPSRGSRAVMILNNVKLPKKLERTLSSKIKGGAIRFVSSFVDGKKMRIEAELRHQSSETIVRQGNKLVWEFAPMLASKQTPTPADQDVVANPKRPVTSETFTSAPPQVVTDPSKVRRVRGMSRKRLTIDLRDADIQNVLRLIATEGGVNIIAGDDVKGTVTMRLRSVPLEQVFLTVLQAKSLGFEMRGNVIRVAPQETLVKEESVRNKARQARRAQKPLEVFLLPISYAKAKELLPQVQGLLSARGNATVDERTNTLIIKDISENLEPIRVLIESLDSQVPQVLIEARIVETNDTFQKQIGIQWGGAFNSSQANGNPTGLIFPGVLGLAGGATDGQTPTSGLNSDTPNFAVNLPAPVGTGSGGGMGLTLGSVGGAAVLNVRLTALETAGHARIISSPKILTLDNTQATISQGTSIPISVVGAAGVQTVFVDATLELAVRPHVTPDGNIQLKIKATKNEPDFQNTGARGDPTIIRRQAETELLIKDGDTTVIGGIYTRNSGSSISAVPFFHKIPILGYFFRTSSESERRNELLIFITPKIVNRAEALGAGSAGSVTTGTKKSATKAAKK